MGVCMSFHYGVRACVDLTLTIAHSSQSGLLKEVQSLVLSDLFEPVRWFSTTSTIASIPASFVIEIALHVTPPR